MNSERQRFFTRTIYDFEAHYLNYLKYLGLPGHQATEERSIHALRTFCQDILKAEGSAVQVNLTAGRGLRVSKHLLSYAQLWTDGTWKIVLARTQRTELVLIHELAHVLTPLARYDHGPAFGRTYMRMLEAYAGVKRTSLEQYMKPAVKELMK